MVVTDRDIDALVSVCRYHILNRQQIQRLHFPSDPNGRITRKRLQVLVDLGFLNRANMLVVHESITAAPVYFPSRRGCEFLAEHFDDPAFLNVSTQAPIPHHIPHWLAVADTHIIFDQAIARQSAVKIAGWLNEYDLANPDASVPEERFQLYTLIQPKPRLICAPDAAFLLAKEDRSKIYYLEQDRATSGVSQIASGKTPGYAALFERNLQQRHFAATVPGFAVLMITLSERRRDNLRKAIGEKPGAALWRFAAIGDVTPEKALSGAIWYSCKDEPPSPLVKGAPS